MDYDFEHAVQRKGTYSMKYDDAVFFSERAPGVRLDDNTIRLMLADMDFPCAPAITKALHRVADHGTFGYTTAQSELEYFSSIIRWYEKRYHFPLKREWIVHSNGALDGIGIAVKAFSDPGDGVLLCRPVYSNFNETIEGLGRKVVNCHLLQFSLGDYRIDWQKFESLCARPENKIYILCSPENPVGRVWTREELQQMASICRKHNVVLVSDEIHSDIIRDGIRHWPILQAVEDHSNLIMISGVNKSFNLMGLACAYSVIPDEILRQRYLKCTSGDFLSPFAIAAVIAAYDESEDWLNALNIYLDEMITDAVGYLQKKLPKAKAYVPQGTYILWVDFSSYGFSTEELLYLINQKANVAVQVGLAHDPEEGGQYIRLCLTAPRPVIREAIDRISAAFEEQTGGQS